MIGRFGSLGRVTPIRAAAAGLVVGVVGVGVAVGVGALELPSPEATLLAVGPTLGQWTYLLVAVLGFLETSTFLGLVLPGEVSIALGGVVAGQGVIRLGVLVPLVWVAVIAGDVTAYWLGRRLGRDFILLRGPRFGMTPSRLEWAERYFDEHGGKTILVGRSNGRRTAPSWRLRIMDASWGLCSGTAQACAIAGRAPIWPRSPATSVISHSSAIRPPSHRLIATPVKATSLPLGGAPMRSPS